MLSDSQAVVDFEDQERARDPLGLVLAPEAIARARRLADIVDQAQAARIAAAPDGLPAFDPVTVGIDAIVGMLRRDPQAFIDDNLGYLVLVNDAVLYVVNGGEPSAVLAEWAPGIEVEP